MYQKQKYGNTKMELLGNVLGLDIRYMMISAINIPQKRRYLQLIQRNLKWEEREIGTDHHQKKDGVREINDSCL